MKTVKLILSVTMLLIAFKINAQTVQWAKQGKGADGQAAWLTCTDNTGNCYVAGMFEGTSTFDNYPLISNGDQDMFVAKYNSAGILQWIRHEGGGSYESPSTIRVDNAGNLYVAGNFYDSTRIGNVKYYSNSQKQNSFLAKYNSSGNLMWVQTGGAYHDAMCIDPTGNSIYMCGVFVGSAIFSGTTITAQHSFFNDIFLVKYNSSGTMQWIIQARGKYLEDIETDISGNVYLTGGFSDTCTFGNTTLTGNFLNMNADNMYVTKCNSSGTFLWAKSAVGVSTTSGSDNRGSAIKTDNTGSVYVEGYFSGTSDFSGTILNSNGPSDNFLSKYNSSGVLQWAKQYGGNDYDGGFISEITTDAVGNIYVVNHFIGTTAIGAATFTTIDDSVDIYISKWDNSGNVLWAYQSSGAGDHGAGEISVDGNALYIAGIFSNKCNLGNVSFSTTGGYDGFFAKMDLSTMGIEDSKSNNSFSAFPNPCNGKFTIKNNELQSEKYEVEIYNVMEEKVFSSVIQQSVTPIDISSQAKGVYFIYVKSMSSIQTAKNEGTIQKIIIQ